MFSFKFSDVKKITERGVLEEILEKALGVK
ncbi:hypothetical protein ABID22_001401 [Pontibacter aydingkolensis]